jgi:hypothetical protein
MSYLNNAVAIHNTAIRGVVISTLASFSGGPESEIHAGNRLSEGKCWNSTLKRPWPLPSPLFLHSNIYNIYMFIYLISKCVSSVRPNLFLQNGAPQKILSTKNERHPRENCFCKVHNFCFGRPLWLLAPGAIKLSYATENQKQIISRICSLQDIFISPQTLVGGANKLDGITLKQLSSAMRNMSVTQRVLRLRQTVWRLAPTTRSHWPCGLRRGSAAARLLGLRVLIPPGACMSVSCDCCVLSGRGFCVGMITRPEESYRLWCVWVWSWSLDNEALGH